MDILDRFSASFTRGFMFAFLNSAILSDTIVWLTTVGGEPISLWFRGAEKLDNNYGLHPGKYTLGLVGQRWKVFTHNIEGQHLKNWSHSSVVTMYAFTKPVLRLHSDTSG